MIQIKITSVLLLFLQTYIISSHSFVTWSTSHLGISNGVGSFPEGMVNASTIDLANHVESGTSNTVSTLSPDVNRINWNVSAIAPILGTKPHCASQFPSKSIIVTYSKNVDFGKFVIITNARICAAGFTAPTLSATTKGHLYPSITLDLNSLVTSTTPTSATLNWYTDAAAATELTTPTAGTANGAYYAFYNVTNNSCFSPASAAVQQAEFISCPINIFNTCPVSSVDLSFALASSSSVVPEGYTQTYHSVTPPSSANRLLSSVVTTPSNYYNYLYSATLNSYTGTSLRPLAVTIKNCCVSDNQSLT